VSIGVDFIVARFFVSLFINARFIAVKAIVLESVVLRSIVAGFKVTELIVGRYHHCGVHCSLDPIFAGVYFCGVH